MPTHSGAAGHRTAPASTELSVQPRGAKPVARPVAAAQARDSDTRLLVGGVYELSVAHVDAVVAEARRVRVLEKDQVAGLELVAARVRATVVFALQPPTDRLARLPHRIPH